VYVFTQPQTKASPEQQAKLQAEKSPKPRLYVAFSLNHQNSQFLGFSRVVDVISTPRRLPTRHVSRRQKKREGKKPRHVSRFLTTTCPHSVGHMVKSLLHMLIAIPLLERLLSASLLLSVRNLSVQFRRQRIENGSAIIRLIRIN
jgi:hypothetical protein